jgi:hypothetical protein
MQRLSDHTAPVRPGPGDPRRQRLSGILALLGVLFLAGSCLAYGVSQQIDFGLGRALSGTFRGTGGGAGMGGQVDSTQRSRELDSQRPAGGVASATSPTQEASAPAGPDATQPPAKPAERAPTPAQAAEPAGPPVPAPPTAAPTALAGAASQPVPAATGSPIAAVTRFYALVEAHDFAAARGLWSPAMQAAYPPAQNLDARFSGTNRMDVRRAELVSLDEARGRAIVAVDLLESQVGSSSERRWIGSWYLVRSPAGWLLDQPALRPG